jgi:hypothetical protein
MRAKRPELGLELDYKQKLMLQRKKDLTRIVHCTRLHRGFPNPTAPAGLAFERKRWTVPSEE